MYPNMAATLACFKLHPEVNCTDEIEYKIVTSWQLSEQGKFAIFIRIISILQTRHKEDTNHCQILLRALQPNLRPVSGQI
jgi:hypothetical protein